MSDGYPVQFDIEYPDRPLNRLTTFFRVFAIIPILIVLGTVSGGEVLSDYDSTGATDTTSTVVVGAGGIAVPRPAADDPVPPEVPALVVRLEPRADPVLLARRRCTARCSMTAIPRPTRQQSLRLDMPYPDAQTELNRWLPLVKWLLAIPHYIVLVFLCIAAFVCIVVAWFAILFTGRYPRGLFDFVVGVGRWSTRVSAYAFLLVTDRYPPFSLQP